VVETTITLPRLEALRGYWRRIPPLNVLMAIAHGVKIEKPAEVIDGKRMFEMIKAAGGKIRG